MAHETRKITGIEASDIKTNHARGTSTSLIVDDGAVAVALTRTMTVVAAFPNTLRGIVVDATVVQEVPLLRLYSIAVDTPVITF